MKKSLIIICFLVGVAFPTSGIGQEFAMPGESFLQTYSEKETAAEKLSFFYQTSDRYTFHSAYDWLDRINADLNSAIQQQDSAAIRTYHLIRAQLYYDLGNFKRSATLSQELYPELESMDTTSLHRLLNLMDENYGKLRQYDKQIEIRERKRQFGISENVSFYDIYSNLGLHRKAMEQYIEEVKKSVDSSDFYQLAVYNNQIGEFLLSEKSSATAMTYFKKAQGYIVVFVNDINQVRTREEIDNASLLKAVVEGNIGKAHILQNEQEEALPYLENSLGVLSTLSSDAYADEKAVNILALASAYLDLENYRKARQYLTGEFDTFQPELQIRHNRMLADYYKATGDSGREALYLKNAMRLQDSINALEAFNQKERLVTIVASEELEKEKLKNKEQELMLAQGREVMEAQDMRINLVFISLVFTLLGFAGLVYAYLKSIKNQRLIAEQKRIIENSLVEKDSLLKEIHHRVKNNLQMVSSLLSLQTKNTRSKAAIEALEEGKTRVKAMALIHQKLYQNDDLSVIEMQGYIESLINSIQSVYRKGGHSINITIDAEGVELDIDRAIPIGLILNELVSNSFKYAFPEDFENGRIYIHIQNTKEGGFFEYTDNGVGLPEDTESRSENSMGIRLIKRLVNQLQSTLNIDKTAEGVRFWFNFK
ncbi:sensor histidine kinase [Robiginitalea sp.]|uniref:sensor histidine kinase n=1 Tax=Robiginitalea sp. TaxID=1902411 RepID=UPI003C766D30